MPDAPQCTAVTEDGTRILVGHVTTDAISVLETSTGKVVKSIATPAPISLLVRGDKLFVANKGKGTISVFSIAKDWEKIDEVEVGHPDVKVISAPQGKAFDGWILATYKEHSSVDRLTLINATTDKHHDYGKPMVGGGAATVAADGKWFIVQSEVWGGGNVRETRDFRTATLAKEAESLPFQRDQSPFLYQVRPGTLWFGSNRLYTGYPPIPTGEPLGLAVVPDRSASVCYALDPDAITCIALDAKRTKVGTAKTAFPTEYERFAKNIVKPNKPQHEDYAFNDRFAVAATLGDKLHVYLLSGKNKALYRATFPAFDAKGITPSDNVVATNDPTGKTGGATTPAAETEQPELPAKVAVGKPFSVKLKGAAGSSWELTAGPTNARIAPDGTLTWTPTKAQSGEQSFKIRVKAGAQIDFVRWKVEVVDASDVIAKITPNPAKPIPGKTDTTKSGPGKSSQTTPELDDVGVLELSGPPALGYSGDGRSIYLADGKRLRVLDATGVNVLKTVETTNAYRRILERPDYLVALGPKSVDLLDKATFQPRKSIDVDYAQINSLAIHPTKKLAYVSVTLPSIVDHVRSKQVLSVDETTGAIKPLPDVYGMMLEVDPAGTGSTPGCIKSTRTNSVCATASHTSTSLPRTI
ncbi:MAG: hypothetical protein QM811_22270 [Pirellulales bacterium]